MYIYIFCSNNESKKESDGGAHTFVYHTGRCGDINVPAFISVELTKSECTLLYVMKY